MARRVVPPPRRRNLRGPSGRLQKFTSASRLSSVPAMASDAQAEVSEDRQGGDCHGSQSSLQLGRLSNRVRSFRPWDAGGHHMSAYSFGATSA